MNKITFIKKPLFWVGLVVVLVLAVGGGKAVSFYRQPLGPPLDRSSLNVPAAAGSSTPENTPETGKEEPPSSTPVSPVSAQEEQAATAPTEPQVEVCGETDVWNVLVLGSDADDMFEPQGSDLTRVLRVDFPNKTATIFAFSRDLWVDTSSLTLTDPSITSAKLGVVFYEARMQSTRTDLQGPFQDGINAIAKTLETNFNLSSDHYLALDLDKFPEMIDSVGGLPVDIPANLTDPRTGMVFTAGEQTLDGRQTATYARAFLTTDLDRIERNHLLIMALRQKLLDPAIWIKIPELFLQFKDAVITDFSPEQVNHQTCLLKEVQEESIIQEGVNPEWTTPGPEDSLLWDKAKVLTRLEELELIP
jgi:LCP family protein required for cell wall assembly